MHVEKNDRLVEPNLVRKQVLYKGESRTESIQVKLKNTMLYEVCKIVEFRH